MSERGSRPERAFGVPHSDPPAAPRLAVRALVAGALATVAACAGDGPGRAGADSARPTPAAEGARPVADGVARGAVTAAPAADSAAATDNTAAPAGLLVPTWAQQVDSVPDVGWLALRRAAAGMELVRTAVTYASAPGPCAEPDGGRTAVPSVGGAWVALVAGVPGLTAGPVSTASVSDTGGTRSLHGDSVVATLGGERLVIRSERVAEAGFRLYTPADGGTTLYSTEYADEGSWDVVWVGDLDRDGALDVLLDATQKYSVDAWRLYLASGRRPGSRWRAAAVYAEAGC